MSRLTPEALAAAWKTWHSRHGGKLGPGPAFTEALEAALAVLLKEDPPMNTYTYYVHEVSYKFKFEPPCSRDFDRLAEAELFAREMRHRGYDCYIFKDQERTGVR